MRINISNSCLPLLLIAVLYSPQPAAAQQVFYDWIGGLNGDWNTDANWYDGVANNFVPSIDEFPGESARFLNGGSAVVDEDVPRIAELIVTTGTVDIMQNGVVETVPSLSSGNATIGGGGRINLMGNGSLIVGGSATNLGNLRLNGPSASVAVAGDFNSAGTIGATITSSTNHGLIDVTGAAELGGTLRAHLSGFSLSLGQSWDIVNAASVSGGFNNLLVESAPYLARGLQLRTVSTATSAELRVDNTLVLTVDRQSGATSIHNVTGGPLDITSYAIRSGNGLLSSGTWTSLSVSNQAGSGWDTANPTASALTELNLEDSHSVALNDTLTLGNPYAGSMALGSNEDVVFEYSTANGEFRTGIVEYTGIANDLALYVDPSNGAAAIGNLSSIFTPPQVTGYSIGSDEGQLVTANWDSFTSTGEAGTGWATANPTSSNLTELNLEGSKEFTSGTLIELGEIFTINGKRDLTFQYVAGGQLLDGKVVYGAIPEPPAGVPGDYNGDNFVNAADYAMWRDNLGTTVAQAGTGADGNGDNNVTIADYQFWRERFGGSPGSGGGAFATKVPEPSAALLATFGLLLTVACGRGRRV